MTVPIWFKDITNMMTRAVSLSWWRHQMEILSALLAICVGNSPVTGEFHASRPVTRSFDLFFDLRLNKRLNKQWSGRWFQTPSHPLWHHCNVHTMCCFSVMFIAFNTFLFPWVRFAYHSRLLHKKISCLYVCRSWKQCNAEHGGPVD